MKPYYQDDFATIYHGHCYEVLNELVGVDDWGERECVIFDPPWDVPEHFQDFEFGDFESLIVFTDARRFRDPIGAFGAPDWVFTWDTLNTWSVSPNQPVQQTKHALWWGSRYDRDAALWGTAPPRRDHPTTKQTPLDGRRLTDLWRESLRWLHHPGAGSGSVGTERFSQRQGHPAMRHAKPVGWLRCLIGNTSSGSVLDPFMGSGSAVLAARDLGRRVVGIDIDEACCELAALRLTADPFADPAQEVLDFGGVA